MLSYYLILCGVLIVLCSGMRNDCSALINRIQLNGSLWQSHFKPVNSPVCPNRLFKLSYFFKKGNGIHKNYIKFTISWEKRNGLPLNLRVDCSNDSPYLCDRNDYMVTVMNLGQRACLICPTKQKIHETYNSFDFYADSTSSIDITFPKDAKILHHNHIKLFAKPTNGSTYLKECSFECSYDTCDNLKKYANHCNPNCHKRSCHPEIQASQIVNSNSDSYITPFITKVVVIVSVIVLSLPLILLILYKLLPWLRSLQTRPESPCYQKSGLLEGQLNCDSCYTCYCKSSTEIAQTNPIDIRPPTDHVTNWLNNLSKYSEVAQQEHRSQSVARDFQLNLPVRVARRREDFIAPRTVIHHKRSPSHRPSCSAPVVADNPFSRPPYLGPLSCPAPNVSPFDNSSSGSIRPQPSSMEESSSTPCNTRGDSSGAMRPPPHSKRKFSNEEATNRLTRGVTISGDGLSQPSVEEKSSTIDDIQAVLVKDKATPKNRKFNFRFF